ncbi:hypothetical protein ABPG72_018804 [Tetrahymena utriculariae]
MIDLLELPTEYEVKKIYLNKGTNISTILQEKPQFPIIINIISFDDKQYSLSFDSIEEISEGLNSACLSISNGRPFIIKEINTEQANYYRSIDDLEYIYQNGIYRLMRDQNEIQNICSNICNVDESFLRKYEEPFKIGIHLEVQAAFKQMDQGEFFYKCSHQNGKIQFIYMRIDQSANQIQYYSRKQILKKIPFSSIAAIKFGVYNDVIRTQFKNRFTDTSLVIVYKNEESIFSSFLDDNELHLTFRTERQFDLWGTGLKALQLMNSSRDISKKNLLWHSRLFKRFYNNQEFQLIDTFFNNSEVYNKHIQESITYETTLLDRRINFCFEKQQDELKAEYASFEKLIKNQQISQELLRSLPTAVGNVYKASTVMKNQINQMKQMIHNLQQSKSNKSKEVDLLDLKESNSDENTNKENKENNSQQVSSRTKQINFLYYEVFKFQFRLHQSISFISNINKKLID